MESRRTKENSRTRENRRIKENIRIWKTEQKQGQHKNMGNRRTREDRMFIKNKGEQVRFSNPYIFTTYAVTLRYFKL